MRKIRFLIVEKNPVAHARIRTLVVSPPDIEVVGEAASGREALNRTAAPGSLQPNDIVPERATASEVIAVLRSLPCRS